MLDACWFLLLVITRLVLLSLCELRTFALFQVEPVGGFIDRLEVTLLSLSTPQQFFKKDLVTMPLQQFVGLIVSI